MTQENIHALFDYCVSNPPYQLDVSKKFNRTSTSVDIFPDFHMSAHVLSNNTMMIYPSSWQKDTNKGFGQWLMNNSIVYCHNYSAENIFGSAIERGFVVGVVHTVNQQNEDVNILINDDITVGRDIPVWFNSSSDYFLYKSTSYNNKVTPGASYMTDLSNMFTSGLLFSDDPHSCSNPVRMYIKRNPGKQADADFYYIEYDDVLQHVSDADKHFNIDKYNVVVPSAIFGRQSLFYRKINDIGHVQARVYDPYVVAGKTLASIRWFNTKEEANNYVLYINSGFVSQLLHFDYSKRTFGRFVPDLEDYTSSNLHIDWGKPLDPQLYKLFDLTDEEVIIIEG